MPAYISLLNFTDQGIQKIKDTTRRARAFQAMARKGGVRVKEVYWTVGRYDVVVIAEAPNDEAITRALLNLSSLGNVRTETLRAFSAKEMDRIIKGVR